MRTKHIPVLFIFLLLSSSVFAQAKQSATPQTSDGTLRLPTLPTASDGTLRLPVPAGFSIQYKPGWKLLTVKSPWPGAVKAYSYALYPRGSIKPTGLAVDGYIATPVRSVVSFSTTYIPPIESIGELAALKGIDSADYVYSPQVRKLFAEGKIVETTKNFMPDIERLIALKTDAIFTFGMGNEWDSHPKMEEAGLPVVMLGDWNEADPIARAEWALFIAAFFDKETLAFERLSDTIAEYERLKTLAKNAKDRPLVLDNGPFNGSWSVSGGSSYMARMLADAGARYLWADAKGTGGINLSVEAVFEKALAAKIWLNPSFMTMTLGEVRAMDPRFASIPALVKGEVWNNNLRTSPLGGSDYFESGATQPQAVLADLIAIFHPELLPGHVFTYYRKLGEK